MTPVSLCFGPGELKAGTWQGRSGGLKNSPAKNETSRRNFRSRPMSYPDRFGQVSHTRTGNSVDLDFQRSTFFSVPDSRNPAPLHHRPGLSLNDLCLYQLRSDHSGRNARNQIEQAVRDGIGQGQTCETFAPQADPAGSAGSNPSWRYVPASATMANAKRSEGNTAPATPARSCARLRKKLPPSCT